MNPLLESLRNLSEAASEVLPLLESYDYRKEAKRFKEEDLPLSMMPKTLKEIFRSVMRYCIPVMGDEDPVRSSALLNADNIRLFTDNLNITTDRQLAHQFQFIELEPIRAVAEEFTELGLKQQARMLENACNFACGIRKANNAAPFGSSGKDLAPVNYLLNIASDEISEEEADDNLHFAQFCSVFAKNSFGISQKQALFTGLKGVVADPAEKRPHLVVMTVIVLLRKRKLYRNPLPGSLNSCRDAIFQSLGLDTKKCHSYGDDSLDRNTKTPLHKYKEKADAVLKSALGNTR